MADREERGYGEEERGGLGGPGEAKKGDVGR